jgi:hypothetical protein
MGVVLLYCSHTVQCRSEMVGHGRGSHRASLRMWLIACFAKELMSFIG